MNFITLKFFSITQWEDNHIESFVSFLDRQTIFRPDKWGPSEPLEFKFSISEVANIQKQWESEVGLGFLLKRRKDNLSISVNKYLQFKKPNWVSVSLNEAFFTDEQRTEAFLDFAKGIFEWGDMLYGYACHEVDFERKNKLPIPTRIEGKLIATGGMDIRRCLPSIYWANFFGGEYVNWFGTNKFQNLPAYTCQSLPKQGQLILTSGSPLDYTQNTVMERELFIRKILGDNAFFDVQNPTLVTDSPFKQGLIVRLQSLWDTSRFKIRETFTPLH